MLCITFDKKCLGLHFGLLDGTAMFSRKKDCFTFGCNFGRKKVTQANRAGSVLEKNDIGIRVQRKLY
jgi:hypothetical protein